MLLRRRECSTFITPVFPWLNTHLALESLTDNAPCKCCILEKNTFVASKMQCIFNSKDLLGIFFSCSLYFLKPVSVVKS